MKKRIDVHTMMTLDARDIVANRPHGEKPWLLISRTKLVELNSAKCEYMKTRFQFWSSTFIMHTDATIDNVRRTENITSNT